MFGGCFVGCFLCVSWMLVSQFGALTGPLADYELMDKLGVFIF